MRRRNPDLLHLCACWIAVSPFLGYPRGMLNRSPLILPALLFTACAADAPVGATCDVGDIGSGEIAAVVDGEDWSDDAATWILAGSSLQINSEPSGGWHLSAVLQVTTTGATLADALDAGSWPVEVDLPPEGGTGGWITFYPDSGDSYVTEAAAGGTLTLAGQTGTDLYGCFAFTAGKGNNKEVTVESGVFRATGS